MSIKPQSSGSNGQVCDRTGSKIAGPDSPPTPPFGGKKGIFVILKRFQLLMTWPFIALRAGKRRSCKRRSCKSETRKDFQLLLMSNTIMRSAITNASCFSFSSPARIGEKLLRLGGWLFAVAGYNPQIVSLNFKYLFGDFFGNRTRPTSDRSPSRPRRGWRRRGICSPN